MTSPVGRPATGPRPEVTVETGPQRTTVCELDSTTATCAACLQPIWWVVTPRGKYLPVDAPGRPPHNLDGLRLTSHFLSCAFPARYRRRRR